MPRNKELDIETLFYHVVGLCGFTVCKDRLKIQYCLSLPTDSKFYSDSKPHFRQKRGNGTCWRPFFDGSYRDSLRVYRTLQRESGPPNRVFGHVSRSLIKYSLYSAVQFVRVKQILRHFHSSTSVRCPAPLGPTTLGLIQIFSPTTTFLLLYITLWESTY